MIISPCISICKTDPSTGYCYGCGRNNDEKKLWKLEETTDEWKQNNLEIIGALFFDVWGVDTTPFKTLSVFAWTVIFIIALFFADKNERK